MPTLRDMQLPFTPNRFKSLYTYLSSNKKCPFSENELFLIVLFVNQAGQQQTAVYREALQYRETTPGSSGNNKESVSSAEGDSISFNYSSSTHTGDEHTHTLTRAASEPSDSYRPPPTAPERLPASTLTAPPPSHQLPPPTSSKVSESKMILYQGYITSIHVLQEKRTTGPAPAPAPAPPVVILDTSSSTATPPVQGFTFGFEVNEDLLKEKEESLVGQDSNGDKGAVIPQSQNSDNDNIMMKNLLSLTSKSQDNDSNRSSEPLKSEAEEEEEEEVEDEGGELEKDKGVRLDLSRFHEEDIDIKKFNYDVILGFVSKGMSHIHYKQPKLMTLKFPSLPFFAFQLGRW